MGMRLSDSILLMNRRANNGTSGILKLISDQSKVELNEILERDMQLKNGQRANFVNQLFSNSNSTSNFSCFFEIQIIESHNYFDPYFLLDQLIKVILSLLDPHMFNII